MEHESTKLTAEERRILAEIEFALRSQKRRPVRDRLRRPSPRVRWIAWTATIFGSAVLAGGLWFGAVAVAATGFVALLIGLSRFSPEATAARMLTSLRRPRHDTPPDDTS